MTEQTRKWLFDKLCQIIDKSSLALILEELDERIMIDQLVCKE